MTRRKPKFKVGQVLAHEQEGKLVKFIKVGYIERGRGYFWYTESVVAGTPYYTEGSLRKLTKREATGR